VALVAVGVLPLTMHAHYEIDRRGWLRQLQQSFSLLVTRIRRLSQTARGMYAGMCQLVRLYIYVLKLAAVEKTSFGLPWLHGGNSRELVPRQYTRWAPLHATNAGNCRFIASFNHTQVSFDRIEWPFPPMSPAQCCGSHCVGRPHTRQQLRELYPWVWLL
jgi:hypothetical protein